MRRQDLSLSLFHKYIITSHIRTCLPTQYRMIKHVASNTEYTVLDFITTMATYQSKVDIGCEGVHCCHLFLLATNHLCTLLRQEVLYGIPGESAFRVPVKSFLAPFVQFLLNEAARTLGEQSQGIPTKIDAFLRCVYS